eukprot:TRINITY_DN7164_c0_g2_i1.p1 TRINITY_DN7164_c0_g2~~TRINITY_DN7164_c0_g2_i1.p1  ORF type:complete len:256 (+),score=27.20 TRINITY_DN7164_c0_g2_i1:64-768(+)
MIGSAIERVTTDGRKILYRLSGELLMQETDEIFPAQVTLLHNVKSIIPDANAPNLILMFRVQEYESQKILEVRATNCMDIFFEGIVEEEQLRSCRRELNLKTTWASYFELVRDSLLEHNMARAEVVSLEDFLLCLRLTHPLENAKQMFVIKGVGKLGFIERAKRIQEMMFEVIVSYAHEEKALSSKIKELSKDSIKRPILNNASTNPPCEDKRKKVQREFDKSECEKEKTADGC